MILPLEFICRISSPLFCKGRRDPPQIGGFKPLGSRREGFPEPDLRSRSRSRLDVELLGQPAGSGKTDAHSRGRNIRARKNRIQILDAASTVSYFDRQKEFPAPEIKRKLKTASTRVLVSIARDLGNSGSQLRLLLLAESKQCSELSRTLTSGHEVLLCSDLDGENTVHARGLV